MTISTPPVGRLDGPTPAQVLACPMGPNDADASTVGGYLVVLLATVWEEGEGFSGKRPFGNSSWEYELYKALVDGGLLAATKDEWGGLEEFDRAAADSMVAAAIESLAPKGATT